MSFSIIFLIVLLIYLTLGIRKLKEPGWWKKQKTYEKILLILSGLLILFYLSIPAFGFGIGP